MNFDQIQFHALEIKQIARKHGISHVSVFGSVVRGENSSSSDIDFLVEMSEGASLFGVAGFCYETGILLGVPVDVVPLSVLAQMKDRKFAANVQREAIPL